MQLLPYLERHMMDRTASLDVIWDRDKETSLKSQTWVKRGGTGSCRTWVSNKILILSQEGSMAVVPQDSQNKDEVFQFISLELQRITVNSQYHLLTTKADIMLSIKPTDLSCLSPCQQEEADTRMMRHLRHAVDQGRAKAYLRTVDSDVVVLAIHFFHNLGLPELCIGFGSGKENRYTQKCWDCNIVKLCPSSILLHVVMLCP